jgi:hypothetical protein
MTDTDDITLSRNVLEMVAIADEFCRMTEDSHKLNPDAFLKSLNSFSALLYLRGSLLPVIVPEYPEANERFVTEEQWENIFNVCRDKTGSHDVFYFLSSHDALAESEKTSIAEGVADVYQDMKDFVVLFRKPLLAARENAVASCRELFVHRWGPILARLMPVLHELNHQSASGGVAEQLY